MKTQCIIGVRGGIIDRQGKRKVEQFSSQHCRMVQRRDTCGRLNHPGHLGSQAVLR